MGRIIIPLYQSTLAMSDLLHLDQLLFHWINHDWHTPWLDAIMPYWRDRRIWFPFYLLFAGWLVWKYRIKALIFLAAVAITIAITDQTSSELIKKNVRRIRPCNDVALQQEVQLLVPCGGGYSFTSSHAANHFAFAVFVCLTLGRTYRKIRIPILLWAASIALGQVYVGVHYPFDILGGALAGTLIAWGTSVLYRRWFSLGPLPDRMPSV